MKKLIYLLLFICSIANAQVVNNPSSSDNLNLSQDATVAPIITKYLANVKANGGSVTEQQVGALNFLLKGLNQLGLLSVCTYLNPCMGNNWQAAVTNVIYQGSNAYITSTATITDAFYNQKYGWILPTGSTSLNTNYNPVGLNNFQFTSVYGFSQNASNSGNQLIGTSTYGILKLNDNYSFLYLQGRNPLASPYFVLNNSQGNHIVRMYNGGSDWYIDGVQHATVSGGANATFPSSPILIYGTYSTYTAFFNIQFGGNIKSLYMLFDAFNAMLGRNITKVPSNFLLFEGDSETASYVPPFGTYSPLYVTRVLSSLKINTVNWQSGSLAVSGRLAETMLTDATGNVGLYNTTNYQQGLNNLYVYMGGINSLGNGTVRTADDVYTNLLVPTFRNRIAAGYSVLIETLPPTSTYTSFAAGGLANYNSTTTGARRLNYLIKSDPNNYNGVNGNGVILSDEIPQFQDPTNTTYFQDGLHYTATSADIRSALVAKNINNVTTNKYIQLNFFTSLLPQVVTTSITGTRDFRNYELAAGSSFVVPSAQQFIGMEYVLTNTSGGNISITGAVTNTLANGTTVRYRSNGTSWTTF